MSADVTIARDAGAATEAEWEELAERVGASPFLRPGWVRAWHRAFGRGALELCCARRGTRLVALQVLERHGGALVAPVNWHVPEYGALAEDEVAARAVMEALCASGARRLELAALAPDEANRMCALAEQRGLRVLRRTRQRAPTLAITQSWTAYESTLAASLRGDLRRQARRLAARGRVDYEVHASPAGAELARLLLEGLAVEGANWKGAGGSAIESQASTRSFYTNLADWAAAHGWLRLAFLRLDGRPLAFDLALDHAGVHYLLKTGYDAAFAELSPGKLLRRSMLERAFRIGLSSYEFLGDAEPWKLQWTVATRPRELVQVFAPSWPGKIDHVLHARARPLIKRVRDLARGG